MRSRLSAPAEGVADEPEHRTEDDAHDHAVEQEAPEVRSVEEDSEEEREQHPEPGSVASPEERGAPAARATRHLLHGAQGLAHDRQVLDGEALIRKRVDRTLGLGVRRIRRDAPRRGIGNRLERVHSFDLV